MQSAEPVTWLKKNVPFSVRFNDIYFSNSGGLEEVQYVFLKGNRLPECWLDKNGQFLIGETGFGTGLNFFVTWKLWREIALPECDLVYHSVERYPLTIEQIVRSISQWPELNPLLEQFKDQYVSLEDTSKIISLDDGNVSLKILIGDATKMLSGVKFAADTWFLDGFAPSRNPDMWSPELFREIARLSKTGTRLATFTAASAVRKGLTEVGFEMKKNVGFSGKREMLTGVKN